MNKTDVAYSLQQNFESKLRFKMPQKNCYFEIFVSSIYVKGCLGWKIFPPKNFFFLFYSSNIFQIKSKMVIKNINLSSCIIYNQ